MAYITGHKDLCHRSRVSASFFCVRGRKKRAGSRSTSGSPTRWKARRPSPHSSTQRRWSRRASICSRACSSSSSMEPRRAGQSSPYIGRHSPRSSPRSWPRSRTTSRKHPRLLHALAARLHGHGRRTRQRTGRSACSTCSRTRSSRRCSSSAAGADHPRAATTSRTSGKWAASRQSRCRVTFLHLRRSATARAHRCAAGLSGLLLEQGGSSSSPALRTQ